MGETQNFFGSPFRIDPVGGVRAQRGEKMTADDVLVRLEALGDAKLRERNVRNGVGERQFGVALGALRTLAKTLPADVALADALWSSGNLDARLVAILLYRPKHLRVERLEAMVQDVDCAPLADWFGAYIVKLHPDKETLRIRWMGSERPYTARLGWSLATERVVKLPEGLDLVALLDRIDTELATAAEPVRWTMNFCLGEIGIHHPEHRPRAVAIGERVGAYRDYPTSPGCTPPYVPIWVAEMVRRQSEAVCGGREPSVS
jgi:3-methyladenine DNA glycosylase AlkD